MSKKDKEKGFVAPEGMKCYQKKGGGSHRFNNRIIKTGQRFWISPHEIAPSIADLFDEVPADVNAVVVTSGTNPIPFMVDEVTNVAEKFEMIVATDEDGQPIKKGNSSLYNVIDESGKAMNAKPLRKGKAEELLEALK